MVEKTILDLLMAQMLLRDLMMGIFQIVQNGVNQEVVVLDLF